MNEWLTEDIYTQTRQTAGSLNSGICLIYLCVLSMYHSAWNTVSVQ